MFWLWQQSWSGLSGASYDARTSEVRLSDLCSRRFVIAVITKTTGRKSTNHFLGIQSDEMAWLRHLGLTAAVLDKEQCLLWLVAKSYASPDKDWPALPSVAIAVRLDFLDQFPTWAPKKIDVRSLWFDDTAKTRISRQSVQTLPVTIDTLDSAWPSEKRTSGMSLQQLFDLRLQKTSVYQDPGFKGEQPVLTGNLADIVKPFDPSAYKIDNPDMGIEATAPEIFGQFLQ